MAQDLAEVLKFGRYEPLFRIGVGGMAEVYAARIVGEGGFQKQVAVKRMLPHLTGDPKFVDMFLDEARLAANVSSPHVVQTLDLGRAEDDSLYIVMELIVGVTLSRIMTYLAERGEPIDPVIGLELLGQAAQGLDDAHEARASNGEAMHLVHRDVSPQNILVGVDGRARMTDFGIAHALYLRRAETRVGERKGKFSYFSPEQAAGEALDRRTDIFALGVVAWELLVGRRLFQGKPHQALHMIQHKEIPPPRSLRSELSEETSLAVMQALRRDPDRRWATAAQLASALRRAALAHRDLPSPRVIGRFVTEVGGAPLARVRRAITGTDEQSGPDGGGRQALEGGTLVLSGSDVSPLSMDEDATWVPGEGAMSLLTAERSGGAPLAQEPTLLLDGGAGDEATQLDEGRAAGLAPPVQRSEGTDLQQAPTGRWLAPPTVPFARSRRLLRRSPLLLLAIGALLLLGASAIALSLTGGPSTGRRALDPPSAESSPTLPALPPGDVETGSPTAINVVPGSAAPAVVHPTPPPYEPASPSTADNAATGAAPGAATAPSDDPYPMTQADEQQAAAAAARLKALRLRARRRQRWLRQHGAGPGHGSRGMPAMDGPLPTRLEPW